MALDPAIVRWLRGLRMHQKDGVASPHKPVLLLAVLDLAESGGLPRNAVPFSPALFERFDGYWRVVRGEAPGRIAYPFWHLGSEPFWTLVPKPGQEEVMAQASGSPSTARLLTWVDHARLDPRLFAALQLPELCAEMRARLVAWYFPARAEAIAAHHRFEAAVYTYEQALLVASEAAAPYHALPEPVRTTAFRRLVLPAYHYTCAVSRLRLTTPDGRQLVEAAHIHRWAASRNDSPRNGLALSPTHHRLFDEGLFTLDAQLRVQVSRQARDCVGDVDALLDAYSGRSILLPDDPAMRPDPLFLDWHRTHCFRQ